MVEQAITETPRRHYRIFSIDIPPKARIKDVVLVANLRGASEFEDWRLLDRPERLEYHPMDRVYRYWFVGSFSARKPLPPEQNPNERTFLQNSNGSMGFATGNKGLQEAKREIPIEQMED